MNQKLKTAVILVVLSVASVFVARFFFASKIPFTLDERTFLRSDGNPNARVWIAEYIDYQCGACALASKLVHEYKTRYPDQIYLQIRSYPLKSHRYGLKMALLAECAARQGKFWPFHRILFERQAEWTKLTEPEVNALIKKYAGETGLSYSQLMTCADSKVVQEAIYEEAKKAGEMGVNRTPTFFINGQMFVGRDVLEQELKKLFGEGSVQ